MIKYETILITGASSGFGRAIAIDRSAPNTILYLLGRDEERLQDTKSICEENGSKVYIKSIDTNNRYEMYNYLKDLDIDIAFVNAGVSGGTSNNDTYKIFNTNVIGSINTIVPIVENMKKFKKGRIVIISSMASFRGMASAPAYSASKACLRYYGEALNNNLKNYNINVNVVCPAFIKTPLTSKNRFSMPLLMTPKEAVIKMNKGIDRNKKFIIYPKIFYYIIKVLSMLPFGIDDYIYSKLPKKRS